MAAPSDKQSIPLSEQEHARATRCIKGAVHDVNNQLGAIMAFAELIGVESGASDQTRHRVDDILSGVEKSSSLLTTLSEMIETRSTSPSEVLIPELVEEVTALFRYELKNAGITLETTLEGSPAPIRVTRVLLVRALSCMIADAIDRLKTAQRKSIRIRIREDDDAVAVTLRDSATDQPCIDPDEDSEASSDSSALSRARDYAQLHHGDLTFDPESGLTLQLPREAPSA